MRTTHLWLVALTTWGIPRAALADPPVTTVYFASEADVDRCPPPVTVIRRMGDGDELLTERLLDCEGQPRPEALRALSILARPRGVALPTEGPTPPSGFVAEGIRELHPELLERLQRIGEAFEGHRIEIVSGYRPASTPTSRHHHGRALDLRVEGVQGTAVRGVLAGLARSGVGWYPRSVFIHLDVRERTTHWVDESGPGEPPRYVAHPSTSAELDLDALRAQTDAALGAIVISPLAP